MTGDGRVVHHDHRPARAGVVAAWPDWLPADVRESVEAAGIPAPWSHQRELADLVHSGRHAAICTATASGKTLAYLLPVMAATASSQPSLGVAVSQRRNRIVTRRQHTAIYLSPTKALAHDQYRAARELGPAGWRVGTLDGDSDQAERRFARDHADFVLTNPDMLHLSVLPQHSRWAGLLGSLRYVVVDEAHRYRGVFGAQVAQVLRRLRRVCAHYGAEPTFVLASATATDAGVSGGLLVGEPVVEVVGADGSPRPARDLLLWQPTDSVAGDAAEVMGRLVDEGRQTITFIGSRTQSELVAQRAAEKVRSGARVASYRSGYLAVDRRELEAGLQTGGLTGVAATNALELGVDVSGMDAVVIAGFPGTMASLWQQAGRAGRRDRDALVVVMAGDDPRDQYLLAHPDLVLSAPVERTVLHPDNPHVLGPHLAAAAQEMPLGSADERWFGPTMPGLAEAAAAQGVLRRRGDQWFWTRPDRAVDRISLRSMGSGAIQIVEHETGRVIGQVDPGAADRTVHPGAVYLHQGDQWLVDQYLPGQLQALVRPARPMYWTQPVQVNDLEVVRVAKTQPFGDDGVRLHLGDVRNSGQVIGYLRRDERTGAVWDQTPLDLPERSMVTRSMWWTIPEGVSARAGLSGMRLGAAAHAAEHTAIGLMGLFAPCDRWDIGGLSTALHPDTGECTIFVHDGTPGGAGFAERGFEAARDWLAATRERLATCACEAGCPACVVSPKCGNGNQMLDKDGALALVTAMLA
ncbi:DEAD/DEAH box helicase [Propionibacteriaceae bacterium G1746]|uniref:DEAD/DEAH box helicase n=1 Tax=Aestuariimicrobium sp. G57 TaxID=3418485 RepID=UPI003C187413